MLSSGSNELDTVEASDGEVSMEKHESKPALEIVPRLQESGSDSDSEADFFPAGDPLLGKQILFTNRLPHPLHDAASSSSTPLKKRYVDFDESL